MNEERKRMIESTDSRYTKLNRRESGNGNKEHDSHRHHRHHHRRHHHHHRHHQSGKDQLEKSSNLKEANEADINDSELEKTFFSGYTVLEAPNFETSNDEESNDEGIKSELQTNKSNNKSAAIIDRIRDVDGNINLNIHLTDLGKTEIINDTDKSKFILEDPNLNSSKNLVINSCKSAVKLDYEFGDRGSNWRMMKLRKLQQNHLTTEKIFEYYATVKDYEIALMEQTEIEDRKFKNKSDWVYKPRIEELDEETEEDVQAKEEKMNNKLGVKVEDKTEDESPISNNKRIKREIKLSGLDNDEMFEQVDESSLNLLIPPRRNNLNNNNCRMCNIPSNQILKESENFWLIFSSAPSLTKIPSCIIVTKKHIKNSLYLGNDERDELIDIVNELKFFYKKVLNSEAIFYESCLTRTHCIIYCIPMNSDQINEIRGIFMKSIEEEKINDDEIGNNGVIIVKGGLDYVNKIAKEASFVICWCRENFGIGVILDDSKLNDNWFRSIIGGILNIDLFKLKRKEKWFGKTDENFRSSIKRNLG